MRCRPTDALAADTLAPLTAISVPQPNATLPAGTVTVSGTATDNAGVAAVQVPIHNRQTGLRLRADGTWGSFTWTDATTTSPGNMTTTWTHTFTAQPPLHARGRRTRHRIPLRPHPRIGRLHARGTTRGQAGHRADPDRRSALRHASAMPNVNALLAEHGVSFPNGFVVNALCCPSRATITKSAYSYTTRVYQNSGTYGPFPGFDDSSTIATWLDPAGYRTSMVGKHFSVWAARAGYGSASPFLCVPQPDILTTTQLQRDRRIRRACDHPPTADPQLHVEVAHRHPSPQATPDASVHR